MQVLGSFSHMARPAAAGVPIALTPERDAEAGP